MDTVILGTKKQEPRDRMCISYATVLFPLAADMLYIRNHFDLEIQRQITDMVGQLKAIFGEIIKNNSWMDEKTKSYALKKVLLITCLLYNVAFSLTA